MFLASSCTCAVYFTYTAQVQLLAKNMAATHVHQYTPFAHAFAYAIKQTPYAFVAKIILCMFVFTLCPGEIGNNLQPDWSTFNIAFSTSGI